MEHRLKKKNRPADVPLRRQLLLERLEDRRLLTDVSAPPILQWFESSYDTIEQRAPDLFMAGYGAVWTPPPSRGDTSDLTVGYDVYDRFDLGYAGKPTLYGTETGLTTMIETLHAAGLDSHVDFVMNHNGYSTSATEGFYEAGGYPGLAITLPTDIDGDFHSAFWGGDEYERLAGLIDIAHEKNHQFIRNPVDPNDSRNIRAGTTPAFGRLANVPDPANRRFYPDEGHNTMYVYDPKTGEADIPVHQFNLDNPLAGDATVENATGYLMRNAQWLIQVVGVDGLRIDAGKHVQGFTLDFLDRAVYRQNPRQLLDGSTKHVFTYSEVYDADPAVLHPHVKKDINPADPGRIGGNRDTLDFKLYFALKENLEHGTQPGWDNWDSNRGAWYQIKDAALDTSPANGQGDTLHNGNAGVTFVQSHDVYKPYQLENVAYAYTLMMPGNTVVYFNGKEFGDNRDFPKAGRADALSVADGSDLTRILKARTTHGRGNYAERWVDSDGLFSFERESSAVTLLSNRTDGGFDSRTLSHVGFAPGTYLVELTGNAADSQRDPFNDIPEVVQVFDDAGVNKVNVRFPRNANANGDWTGGGYLIYGLPAPQAPAGLELIGVDSILAGNSSVNNDFQNGSQRQTDLHVVTADQLNVRLQTVEVNLLGSLRDAWADGDNALLKLDGGRPINTLNPYSTASGVDYDQPGDVTYGFERFEQKSSPLIGPGGLADSSWQGDGEFLQTIDTSQLEEGPHFLEARAFRHRTDDGPAVFESFKKVIYVDRLPPDSTVASFEPWDEGVRENRDLVIRSLDKTADNVHVFLNLPAGTSDGQIMDMVNDGQGETAEYDRDLFKYGYFNVPHGNNVATIVSFEPTGNSQIQRVPGLFTSTIVGAGLGDLNHDGQYNETDVQTFKTVFESNQQQFNPAGDFNADGLTTYYDLVALIEKLRDVSASGNTLTAAQQLQDQVFGAGDDTYSVHEDSILVVDPSGILANDRDPGSEGSLNLETTGEVETTLGGKATVEATGRLRYVPPASTQSLGLGESTQDSVQYVVNDGLGSTDTGTVTLTVTGINDLPVLATLPPLTLNEDGSFHGNGTQLGDYLSDIDSDSDEIQYRITNMASIDSNFGISIGMASNSDQFAPRSDNSIHIHPAHHFHGQTTVTIEARDLAGGVSNTQSFTVTINSEND
ncbi:MAG: Ig-like domain-containing protein, partial [Pirellulaceae bacterium]